jgi:polyisoprenoid-binding protein YceI/uncharacterized lipoprotein NlpE involved in copper resistance
MKTKIFKVLIAALFLMGCQNNKNNNVAEQEIIPKNKATNNLNFDGGKKPDNRLLPDKLRELPTAINAGHFPNPCYAELIDGMYVWKHNTTVVTNEDLQLVEYGSFVYTNDGWYLRVSMTAVDFEAHYKCKDGLLKKGVVYTDESSWRRGDTLIAGDALWYYIAKDKNGKRIKGIALIETEGKLLATTANDDKIIKSTISWTGYGEIGDYSLTGKIQLKQASIQWSGDTLKQAAVEIKMNSITHEQQNLVDHLKGTDFFETEKYPTANFVADVVDNANTMKPIMKGKMTIKGITKPISFPITIVKKENYKIIKGNIKIDRTLFGIKYNSSSFFGSLGDQAIKNNFELDFELEVKIN